MAIRELSLPAPTGSGPGQRQALGLAICTTGSGGDADELFRGGADARLAHQAVDEQQEQPRRGPTPSRDRRLPSGGRMFNVRAAQAGLAHRSALEDGSEAGSAGSDLVGARGRASAVELGPGAPLAARYRAPGPPPRSRGACRLRRDGAAFCDERRPRRSPARPRAGRRPGRAVSATAGPARAGRAERATASPPRRPDAGQADVLEGDHATFGRKLAQVALGLERLDEARRGWDRRRSLHARQGRGAGRPA